MRKVIFLFLEVSLMQVACTVVRRSEYFRDMNNLHLRVLAFNYIGVLSVVKNSDGNYSYSGFSNDLLMWMSEFYRLKQVLVKCISIIFFLVTEYVFTRLEFIEVDPIRLNEYGFFKTLIDQLINDEVDFVPMWFIKTWQRSKVIEFTYPIDIQSFRFLLPYPEEESRFHAVFRPLRVSAWLLLIGLTIMLVCFMSWLFKWENRNVAFDSPENVPLKTLLGRYSHFAMSLVSGRSSCGFYYVMPYDTKFPLRLVLGIWFLATVVIATAYTSKLTSYLTVPKLKTIVNSFEELAASPYFKIISLANSALSEIFLNASKEPYKKLGQSLRRNPHLLLKNGSFIADTVLRFNGAYSSIGSEVLALMTLDEKRTNGMCRLTASKPLDHFETFSMAFQKGHPFSNTFNIGVQRLWENGMLHQWSSIHFMKPAEKCFVSNINQQDKGEPLKLIDFSSPFVLLIGGIILSSLVFFFHVVLSRFMKKLPMPIKIAETEPAELIRSYFTKDCSLDL